METFQQSPVGSQNATNDSESNSPMVDFGEPLESLYHAISLIEQCKYQQPRRKVDTAIKLLRLAATSGPSISLHKDATRNLAHALSVRFMFSKEISDWKESLFLLVESSSPENEDGQEHMSSQMTNFHAKQLILVGKRFLLSYLQSPPPESVMEIAHLLHASFTAARHGPQKALVSALSALSWLWLTDIHLRPGNLAPLDPAISALSQAVDLSDQDDQLNVYGQLFFACVTKYLVTGNISSLEAAIALEKPAGLNHTLHAYVAGEGTEKSVQDVLSAHITLARKICEVHTHDPERRQMSLSILATYLETRPIFGGDESDLDEVIVILKKILAMQSDESSRGTAEDPHGLQHRHHPHGSGSDHHLSRSIILGRLAVILDKRSKDNKFAPHIHIKEVTSIFREALEAMGSSPSTDANRLNYLDRLSSALTIQYEEDGQEKTIDEAIAIRRQMLEVVHPPDQLYIECIDSLGSALFARYHHFGRIDDIDEAISLHRQSLYYKPSPHPRRALSLSNLAGDLIVRLRRLGVINDLDEAIVLLKEAVHLPGTDAHKAACFNNLSVALMFKTRREDSDEIFDEAILMSREALALQRKTHRDYSEAIDNMAASLMDRYKKRRTQADIDEAVPLFREALNLRPPPHPKRSLSLRHLAMALRADLRPDGNQQRIEEAIALSKEAIDILPPGHSHRSAAFETMANMLLARAHISSAEEAEPLPQYINDAMIAFGMAMQCAMESPIQRFLLSNAWSAAADKYNHSTAVDAYDAALETLPQLASLDLDVHTRQQMLRYGTDGLARRAAAWATRNGLLNRAVEYLEAGRAVLWSQALNARRPLDRLKDVSPELENRFRSLSSELEKSAYRNASEGMMDNSSKMILEEESVHLARANKAWLETVKEIRQLDGFGSFLRTERLETLQKAAMGCPIIFLIPGEFKSDCLIVTPSEVQHIELSIMRMALVILTNMVTSASQKAYVTLPSRDVPDFIATHGSEDIKEKLSDWVEDSRLGGKRVSQTTTEYSSDQLFSFVLGILWESVVKPIITHLGLEKSKIHPARLQWCPTGMFTFLPIHASGYSDPNCPENSEWASDYICSSYTPTIGSLIASKASETHRFPEEFKMMVVVDTERLFSTQKELDVIKEYVPAESLVQLGVPNNPAHTKTILDRLPAMNVVHFACHGVQDTEKPLDSALLVQDGRLTIADIMKTPLTRGALAFLCACETTKGDKNLPDETISIAASLIEAGFKNVIGTMWKMMDADGPLITEAFYKELFRGPDGSSVRPDFDKSALALHTAVQKLRVSGVEFRRWVPFIHMGK